MREMSPAWQWETDYEHHVFCMTMKNRYLENHVSHTTIKKTESCMRLTNMFTNCKEWEKILRKRNWNYSPAPDLESNHLHWKQVTQSCTVHTSSFFLAFCGLFKLILNRSLRPLDLKTTQNVISLAVHDELMMMIKDDVSRKFCRRIAEL